MSKEYRSPGAGEGGGTRLEARRSWGGPPWGLVVLALLVLVMQAACATGYPMGGRMTGSNYRHQSLTPPEGPEARKRAARAREAAAARARAAPEAVAGVGAEAHERGGPGEEEVRAAGDEGAPARPRRQARRAGEADEAEEWEGEGVGWKDGVGDGRPYEVPMSLDYFQGFLVRAGVPSTAVPVDGRTLSPEQATGLLPHLLSTPVTLGNFGPRRMAAHLLKVGEVWLADDGTLRAGRFEVGPFYAVEGGRLFPVEEGLQVPRGARPAGVYEPDDGVVLPVAEGAVLAVVDMVEGIHRLVFHTGETLEGLAQLPGAVRQLYENAPELWEEFRHKPYAERVRTVSRLTTGIVLTVGTSGAGAAKAASWGGQLGKVSFPLLSLTGRGELALRLVAVPVGRAVAVSGGALSTTYVLHMASTGAQGAGGGGGWPPVGGPGRWKEDTTSMSEQSRDYQAQVTGAPKRWCYKICRGGECAEYDGYEPKEGVLLEAKARRYEQWFDEELNPTHKFYKGLDRMLDQAARQFRVAGGQPVRWHVAEPRMVAVLRKYFDEAGLGAIEVVYTQPVK